MGLFSSIKKALSADTEVVFEGASEEDREVFNGIVRQISLIYKGKSEREGLLMLKFDSNVKTARNSEGEIVYRIFGNKSLSRESLYKAYKNAALDAVKTFTP